MHTRKGIIPKHAGDITPRRGMTILRINQLNERPFWTVLAIFFLFLDQTQVLKSLMARFISDPHLLLTLYLFYLSLMIFDYIFIE